MGLDGSNFMGDAGPPAPGGGYVTPGYTNYISQIMSPPPTSQSALQSAMNSMAAGTMGPGPFEAILEGLGVGNQQQQLANQNNWYNTMLANQAKQIANQNQQSTALINNLTGQNGVLGKLFSSMGNLLGGSGGLMGGLGLGGVFGGSTGAPDNSGAQQALSGFGAPMLTGFQALNGHQGASLFGAPAGEEESPTNFTSTLSTPKSNLSYLPAGQRGLFNAATQSRV